MTTTERAALTPNLRRPALSACALIGVGSVLSVVAMSHHPSAHSPDLRAMLQEIAQFAGVSRTVHGGLIVLMALVFQGYWSLSRCLGFELERVRTATIAHGLGVVCMLGAAVINGFALSELAQRCATASDATLEALRPVLAASHALNQALAQCGTVAFSVALLAWSSVLVGQRGLARAVGVFGLVVGVVPVIALVTERLELDVRGMGAVVVAQGAWGVAVAAWMWRLRRSLAREATCSAQADTHASS
ncbi:MAG: hypothetical protein IT454_03855 [Planctomycetes bacterium]|nr:hypothetical protein [Planctomycetota bacterium]